MGQLCRTKDAELTCIRTGLVVSLSSSADITLFLFGTDFRDREVELSTNLASTGWSSSARLFLPLPPFGIAFTAFLMPGTKRLYFSGIGADTGRGVRGSNAFENGDGDNGDSSIAGAADMLERSMSPGGGTEVDAAATGGVVNETSAEVPEEEEEEDILVIAVGV